MVDTSSGRMFHGTIRFSANLASMTSKGVSCWCGGLARQEGPTLAVEEAALAAVQSADAVCFGSLAQRTAAGASAVRRLVDASGPDALRIFDVNLRLPFVQTEVVCASLERTTVVKLNDQELPVLAGMLGLEGTEERQLAVLNARGC